MKECIIKSKCHIVRTFHHRTAEITLANGKTFTVKTNRRGADDCYIKAVKLNGKKYKKNYITYADIMAGGTLEFVMGK